MSNETKRNVFVNLAKDVKINDFFDEEYPKSREDIEKEYKENIHNYDAALPDDLPVIPKAVGNQIVEDQGEHLSDELHWADQGALGDRKLSNWIADNENTFALAWVLGVWSVEETGEIVKLEE